MADARLTVRFLEFTGSNNCSAVPDTICFCIPNQATPTEENSIQILTTKTGRNSFDNRPRSSNLNPSSIVNLLIVDPNDGNQLLFTVSSINLNNTGTFTQNAAPGNSSVILCNDAQVRYNVRHI